MNRKVQTYIHIYKRTKILSYVYILIYILICLLKYLIIYKYKDAIVS